MKKQGGVRVSGIERGMWGNEGMEGNEKKR